MNDHPNPQIAPERYAEAVRFAASKHRSQPRKGTAIPYLSHLLAVSSLVLEDGGTEDQAIAALLHDAAEDQGGEPVIAEISERFGDTVARIVRECSDFLGTDAEVKPDWRERKEAYVASLATMSQDALLVTAADKLHNADATLVDVRTQGPAVWTRFQTGREGFLWYHGAVAEALRARVPHSRSLARLRETLRQLVAAE